MSKIIELLQALNAKLCHDLAGSIGTVDNCLNLIDNDNKAIGKQAKELAIIESANLVKRIKFFRTVYGLSEGEDKLSLVTLSKLLQDFFADTKVKFSIKHDPGVIYMNFMIAKAVICLAVIAGSSAISGGEVAVFIPEGDKTPITIKATGKNIVVKEDSLNILKGEPGIPISVSNCREHYVNSICSNGNYNIKVTTAKGSLEFSMNKK
ncbi:MAG: histidine phosphotransferase family protein [Rickettsiaceae bacterium]|nr:histidine phosphotransferase family protein [Rickettsiaceae bacterium]